MPLDSANGNEQLEHGLYTPFGIIGSFGSEHLHPVDLALGRRQEGPAGSARCLVADINLHLLIIKAFPYRVPSSW